MNFEFNGKKYSYDDLKKANIDLIIEICKSLKVDPKYFARILFMDRDDILKEIFKMKKTDVKDEKNTKEDVKEEKNFDDKNKVENDDEMKKDFTPFDLMENVIKGVEKIVDHIDVDNITKTAQNAMNNLKDGFSGKNIGDESESIYDELLVKSDYIVDLAKNSYDYDFINVFANAFKKYREDKIDSGNILIIKETDKNVGIEVFSYKFAFIDNVLNASCIAKNSSIRDFDQLKDIDCDFIILDKEIDSVSMRTLINFLADVKVDMLDKEELEYEKDIINSYMESGDIKILFKYDDGNNDKDKTIYYKSINDQKHILIDKKVRSYELKRAKGAKLLKVYISNDINGDEIIVDIKLKDVILKAVDDINSVDKYFDRLMDEELLIVFSEDENYKIFYKIFVKDEGILKESDDIYLL
ncbi:MAG: hypothetical protein ACRC57_03910 [Sarcina sp.]